MRRTVGSGAVFPSSVNDIYADEGGGTSVLCSSVVLEKRRAGFVRIDHTREVGKGNTQSKGVHGQNIEISGWRRVYPPTGA